MNILIINGSLRGTSGNSAALAKHAAAILGKQATILTLSDPLPGIREMYQLLASSAGFLVISGVYWNNWSSPLQRFIEVVSAFENTPAFFGKPVACAVSMDSVGGIEVAARLHGVFGGLGCWTPPCSTLVISRTGQEAIAASAGKENDPNEDVWRLDDLSVVLHNLQTAAAMPQPAWKAWPHRELQIADGPWPGSGALDLESPKFL
ncbi:NAD(P)H-dependent oxidoreductase [Chitinophaga sancti]|uniref:NAD(P)H-dependent FMN reductase n=1 Tax=Chitinophaga sancti TaxID=1004 RepID=A0A1K1MWS9_9BACT|nr:NAD(P)H-dependent oxidoreductase [Chitinophaga sancti]WQD63048.1 NAD(P)H-dependent oxidoreductase [Chitinophaga sancti]WQG91327.1 NAD(P)H-dependent oxidoreductase [Chitinophaga sancti]SFW27437.1 NAD(P)H-dependent FMN reductase [Chitinophaga sancti]